MSRPNLLALLCLTVVCAPALAVEPRPLAMVIHGGAGVIDPAKMTPERAASYRAGLAAALDAGYAILERGGSSLDAVPAAVRIMEDDPQFNAGRGAVLNHEGDAELGAAIMDGHGPRAGAVAAVRHVKNPVELARLVMEKSPHVLLVAEGAEEFALEQGVALVPRGYFRTEGRERELEEARRAASERLHAASPPGSGTVGAVALDGAGHLAAATSTGGLTDKHRGRVGDSPIIGAGTYADEACAVSGTGQGEFFIRQVVAYDLCALMEYRHLTGCGRRGGPPARGRSVLQRRPRRGSDPRRRGRARRGDHGRPADARRRGRFRAAREESDRARAARDGEVAPCAAGGRRRRGVRARRGPAARAQSLLPHRGAPRAARGRAARATRLGSDARRGGHRGGGGARWRRQSRRRHLDRRDDQQATRARRRLADHRRGDLRQERRVRGLGDRARRVFHTRRGRPPRVRRGRVPRPYPRAGGA